MPPFVKGDPPSPPLVVLAVVDVDDCDYICSMSHMICMQHIDEFVMAAKFSQRSIIVRRIVMESARLTPVQILGC